MEIYKLIMLSLSFLFVLSAVKKIKNGMSFEEYSIGRGFFLWAWFIIKAFFTIATLIVCIDWSFLNYKITF